ncbi:MAG: DUF2281 domain-containing protein [Lachnospiraceae bacterium]|nr:DUF2281 domain-containing protein [Lachnospiraceae bacterium]
MVYDTIIEEAKKLPEEGQEKVLNLIYALLIPQNDNTRGKTSKTVTRRGNILAGKLKYMADDFDETPECFKEYVG